MKRKPARNNRRKQNVFKWLKLKCGAKVKLDTADYLEAIRWSWQIDNGGYAYIKRRHSDGMSTLRMHRWLVSVPQGKVVDHINGDKMDNRRKNLRVCTWAQSSRNRRVRRDSGSGYKGVYATDSGKWRARITVKGHRRNLGTFGKLNRAIRAYNLAAGKDFKDYAWLNHRCYKGPLTAGVVGREAVAEKATDTSYPGGLRISLNLPPRRYLLCSSEGISSGQVALAGDKL